MAEYIKKSIAIAIVSDSADMYPFEKNEAIRRIEDSTPADVAPVVHGKWEHPHWHNSTHCMNCSVCKQEAQHGEFRGVEKFYPICPNCGAKMDLED